MKIKEILEATQGKLLSGNENDEILGFNQDSRQIKEGDMYIPIVGEKFDGHQFIEAAFQQGAKATLTSQVCEYENKDVILVEDTKKALQDMAAYLRQHRDVKVVAVTGSVGKTTSRDMIYSVIVQKYKTLKTEGNYNNDIGLPLTILRYQDQEVMVLEMGMNHLQEISLLSHIAKPDIACITNVGTAHIGELKSRENILKAKLEIIDGMNDGVLIINDDNDMLHQVSVDQHQLIRCGHSQDCIYQVRNCQVDSTSSQFEVLIDGLWQSFQLQVQGEHNISNALLAIAIGRQLDIDVEDIQKGLASFELTKSRMDVEEVHGMTFIDGTYNASEDSMISSLAVLSKYPQRKIAVLGDMLELGSFSEELHREVGKNVVKHHIDMLVCFGKEAEYISDEASQGMNEVYSFLQHDELITFLKSQLKTGDVVLFKASHGMNLKKVVDALK